ncbi:MAG: M48 family metallopeptidase [Gallionella sp.]|nr:M48 family metallopeptidase [Gallionella sp.]
MNHLILKSLILAGLCLPAAQAFDLGQELRNAARDLKKPGAASSLGGYSETEEVAIGRQIAGNLLGASPLVPDKKLQKYVNNVGRWVASQSERADLEWHFGVIESNDINAFAAPGGYIFMTRGLYKQLKDESELAGVLAHEIAHVIKKHHLKILQQSRMVDLGGKLLGKQAGGNDNIRNLIGSGAEIVSRSLDKGAEFEADRTGIVLAARAGYNAYGLPGVLQQIGHSSADDSSVALLFKTHPHPDERLAKLDDAMDSRFDGTGGKTLAQRLYKIR